MPRSEKFKQTVGRVERNEIEVAHGSGGDRPWRKRTHTKIHAWMEGWKKDGVAWACVGAGRIDRITGRTTWYYDDRCILSIFAMGAWALVHESPRRICMINHWTSRAGTTGSPDRLNERWRGNEGTGGGGRAGREHHRWGDASTCMENYEFPAT